MYVGSSAAQSYAAPAPTYAPQTYAAPAPLQVPFAQTHTSMPTHYEDAPTQGQDGDMGQELYGGFGQMESAHLDRPSGVSFPAFY